MKNSVIKNLIWHFSERFLAQLITTVVSIILARILLPEDYGAVAIIMIFINFCNILVAKGFNASLIQKKDADSLDYSTAFYINLTITIGLYIALFFFAPIIADLYKLPILKSLIRVMGIRLPFTALNSVQNAYISQNMMFKKYFFGTLIGTILSSIVGVMMAFSGFGAWALVGQYLTNTIINSITLWLLIDWRPKLLFSIQRARSLFSFGWKILVSGILDEMSKELKSFVIGKKYSAADLAYYQKGNQFPSVINTNVNLAIGNVLFPVFAKKQTDLPALREYVRKSLKVTSFVMFPLLFGMAAVSDEFLRLLLTDKWAEAVPFMQIFCFSYLFTPIYTANVQAVKALGKGGHHLWNTLIVFAFSLIMVIITANFGVLWMAIGGLISTVFSALIYAIPSGKLLNYGLWKQFKDLLPTWVLAGTMMLVVSLWDLLTLPLWVALLVKIISGVIYYVLFAKIFKFESFQYIWTLVFSHLKSQNKESSC